MLTVSLCRKSSWCAHGRAIANRHELRSCRPTGPGSQIDRAGTIGGPSCDPATLVRRMRAAAPRAVTAPQLTRRRPWPFDWRQIQRPQLHRRLLQPLELIPAFAQQFPETNILRLDLPRSPPRLSPAHKFMQHGLASACVLNTLSHRHS